MERRAVYHSRSLLELPHESIHLRSGEPRVRAHAAGRHQRRDRLEVCGGFEPAQQLRNQLHRFDTTLVPIRVRVQVNGAAEIIESDAFATDVAMQVKCANQWYVCADDLADVLRQVTFDVLV